METLKAEARKNKELFVLQAQQKALITFIMSTAITPLDRQNLERIVGTVLKVSEESALSVIQNLDKIKSNSMLDRIMDEINKS